MHLARGLRRRHRPALPDPLEPRRLLTTWYVDASAPAAPTPTGASWSAAYPDLQLALAAAVPGDTIRVARGTYKPTATADRTASFRLRSGVALYGGYAGRGAPDPDARGVALHPTVLSGDLGVAGAAADNSYHVVDAGGTDATAVLDGFTVTAGNANGTASDNGRNVGGGLYVTAGSPTLANCTFAGNAAGRNGGGAFVAGQSAPAFVGCTFAGNAAAYGGGVYNASAGAAPSFADCAFAGNAASWYGGGVYNSSAGADPSFARCTFTRNSAGFVGGGVHVDGSSPSFSACAFAGNSAGSYGGGIYATGYVRSALVNCTFVGNSADTGGGAIACHSASSPTLVNCTLAHNAAGSYGGAVFASTGSAPSVVNSVVWGNAAPAGGQFHRHTADAAPAVTRSLVQGGHPGASNLDADPLFRRDPHRGTDNRWGTPDDDYGHLRLFPNSPALDAGSDAAVPAGVTTDVAGTPRAVDFPGTGGTPGAVVDLGAYEQTADLGDLAIPAGRTVALPAGAHAFSAASLTIDPAAALDLTDSTLLLGGPPQATAGSVRQYLVDGRLTSSAPDPYDLRAVGYAPASPAAALLIRLTPTGDANMDGLLDADDLLLTDRGRALGLTAWSAGDFDYDGQVTDADLDLLYARLLAPMTEGAIGPAPTLALTTAVVAPAPVAMLSAVPADAESPETGAARRHPPRREVLGAVASRRPRPATVSPFSRTAITWRADR